MNIRTVTFTYSRKYNLSNYESAELSTMLVGDLEIGDDPLQSQEELRIRCVSAVHDAAIELGYAKPVPPVRVQLRGNRVNESFDYDSNPY